MSTAIPTGYTITRREDDRGVTWKVTAPNGRAGICCYRREAVAAAQAHYRSGGLRWS